jgi:AAA15 family ATPase/GTPase
VLINFSLENVNSFKTTQNLSMEASTLKKDDFLADNLIKNKDKSYIKTALMYGANASGKTNFIKSILQFKKIILSSNDLKFNFTTEITPFLLSTSSSSPSVLEITFIENNIKYRYGISFFLGNIKEEWLYFNENVRETCLFYREGQEIEFNKSSFDEANIFVEEKKSGYGIIQRTSTHTPFISTLAAFESLHSSNVVNFFKKIQIVSGLDDGLLGNYTFDLFDKDPSFREWALKILKDFYIEDILISETENNELEKISSNNQDINNLLESLRKVKTSTKSKSIEIVKRIPFTEDRINFPLSFESSGTKKILHLLGPFYDTFKSGHILFIDEFDSKFHTLLSKEIFKLFHRHSLNSQMIVNVQDTNLMDTNVFRRDQIWFVHKDPIEQDSQIYSLMEYKNVIKESYSEDYLSGDFDAIPLFNSFQSVKELMESNDE